VLAVEERHQVEEQDGQQRHLLGEAGGIAQPHEPLAVVLDGKGLEGPEPRPVHVVPA
jgi:hypothetical protein